METKDTIMCIIDKLMYERDAAESRVAALETACIEARQWILRNDDLSDNGAGRVLKIIRDALMLTNP